MTSFGNRHFLFLFSLKGGGKKLGYGRSAEDALEVLALRLTEEEMALIIVDDYIKIHPKEMLKHVDQLR